MRPKSWTHHLCHSGLCCVLAFDSLQYLRNWNWPRVKFSAFQVSICGCTVGVVGRHEETILWIKMTVSLGEQNKENCALLILFCISLHSFLSAPETGCLLPLTCSSVACQAREMKNHCLSRSICQSKLPTPRGGSQAHQHPPPPRLRETPAEAGTVKCAVSYNPLKKAKHVFICNSMWWKEPELCNQKTWVPSPGLTILW